MLTLRGRGVEFRNVLGESGTLLVRLTEQADRPQGLRRREALLLNSGSLASGSLPDGFRAYVAFDRDTKAISNFPKQGLFVILPDEYSYLADGDVIRLEPRNNAISALYRRNSLHNTFLVTERCNHYCLMCSQPPRDIDDSWLVEEIIETMMLIDPATKQIGITGGEPTLLSDSLIRILETAKSYLPHTAIHVLSNGRKFADWDFVTKYAAVEHPDLMVGIPIYSDLSTVHDCVVQADNAFDETIRGILNLKQKRQKIELRVVIHQQTFERLPQLAGFIARNLMFVDQVALMGLEITGFTKPNLNILWIDPVDYQRELYDAVTLLADYGMNVLIYNHQLCVLDRRLWPFAVKSISDWKNEYMPECEGCTKMEQCGGFFSSARQRYSDHIRPIR
jgi:His-Xaa-Ser system radical SAM maturase HxsC